MELRGCRDQRDCILCILRLGVASVCHPYESFKMLNRAIQHPSCPHNLRPSVCSISNTYTWLWPHKHMHALKSLCPRAVINAITNRVTEVSAGHGLLSTLHSHGQAQRWRSSCQSHSPSCSSTTEQKAQPHTPSVCTFCTDLGFCRGCGPPDCEWSLHVALVVTVRSDHAVGQRGGGSQNNKDLSC